jgi:hypothetical protein
MEISNDGATVTLCGVQGCCPTLNYIEGGVELKDDFGGKVKLSSAEWGELVEGVKTGQLH